MAPSLTDAQLRAELERCQTCEARPCRSGCPAGCSPADFLLAARGGAPSDLARAAAHVLAHNPLGGACGQVCPETLCMSRCSRRALDEPVRIPAVQEAIVRRARATGLLHPPAAPTATGHRVAVVGAGPAGLGAASVLARAGHEVHVLDRARRAGGMLRLLPRTRLDPEVLEADLAGILALGDVRLVLGRPIPLPRELLARGFSAVVVAAGLGEPVPLAVPGAARALPWAALLGDRPPALEGRRVAVVGDGLVALDCAEAALARGAAHVELLARKALGELDLGRRDRDRLLSSGIHFSGRVRVAAIRGRGDRVSALVLRRLEHPADQPFHPSRLTDARRGEHERRDLDAVVLAMGGQPGLRREPHPRVLYAGDLEAGPTTVVEALASGKQAALAVNRLLLGDELAPCPDRPSCPEGGGACPRRASCPEWSRPASGGGAPPRPPSGLPVALDCEVLGVRLRSPFLLAAPHFTDRHDKVRRAYEAGWPGAVTSLPAAEVARLREQFPDRLTLGARERAIEGDPADARAAAALLARGAQAVWVDALVGRHGLGALNDLEAGLSWLLSAQGLRSPAELASSPPPPRAAPDPFRPAVAAALCTACGSCLRCPAAAISLDARGLPAVSEDRCDGCALCVDWCVAGAIARPSA